MWPVQLWRIAFRHPFAACCKNAPVIEDILVRKSNTKAGEPIDLTPTDRLDPTLQDEQLVLLRG